MDNHIQLYSLSFENVHIYEGTEISDFQAIFKEREHCHWIKTIAAYNTCSLSTTYTHLSGNSRMHDLLIYGNSTHIIPKYPLRLFFQASSLNRQCSDLKTYKK